MVDQTQADGVETDSTLTFETDERFPNSPIYELVAEGIHERGERSVRVAYVLDTEIESILSVTRYYRVGGERVNEDSGVEWSLTETHDGYTVDYNGQTLREFVRDNFEADPETETGEAFDSMVSEGGR